MSVLLCPLRKGQMAERCHSEAELTTCKMVTRRQMLIARSGIVFSDVSRVSKISDKERSRMCGVTLSTSRVDENTGSCRRYLRQKKGDEMRCNKPT